MTRTITCLGSGILIYNIKLHWPCSWEGEHHKMYVWARLDRVFYTFLPLLRATRQLLDEERGNLLVGSPSIHMNFIWRYLGVYFISIGSAIFPWGRVTFMWVFVFFFFAFVWNFPIILFLPTKTSGVFDRSHFDIFFKWGGSTPPSHDRLQIYDHMQGYRVGAILLMSGMEPMTPAWKDCSLLHVVIVCYNYIHVLCITYVFICISMYACI